MTCNRRDSFWLFFRSVIRQRGGRSLLALNGMPTVGIKCEGVVLFLSGNGWREMGNVGSMGEASLHPTEFVLFRLSRSRSVDCRFRGSEHVNRLSITSIIILVLDRLLQFHSQAVAKFF